MEGDREAGVESLEGRGPEEFAYAWDMVVHSGYVPVRTLLGTCCKDFYWPIRRWQFAWLNQVVFEDLMHVWQLVSRVIAERVHLQWWEGNETLCFAQGSLVIVGDIAEPLAHLRKATRRRGRQRYTKTPLEARDSFPPTALRVK